ncbi:hypothetical protein EC991_008341 [Linnemannia zychae]|nr:hypothetical protein EC991_008341 [Linnemannia zychae]
MSRRPKSDAKAHFKAFRGFLQLIHDASEVEDIRKATALELLNTITLPDFQVESYLMKKQAARRIAGHAKEKVRENSFTSAAALIIHAEDELVKDITVRQPPITDPQNPTPLMLDIPILARLTIKFIPNENGSDSPPQVGNRKRRLGTAVVESSQKTPRRRAHSTLSHIATASVDSPNLIPATYNKNNPFLDDAEEEDFMIPDTKDNSYCFSAILDGLDVGGSFGQLFQDVRAKKIYVTDTDQVLARSGIILISKAATAHQVHFFGRLFSTIREKALQKWKSAEVAAVRNEVRSWLDGKMPGFFAVFATNPKHRRLWTYVVSALQEFPVTDTTRAYSESTAISSFILPICRVFVAAPDKKLFLNLKKNAKDLVRVGEMLKNVLDGLQDDFGASHAVVPSWQVIGQVMSIYIMFRCGNLYLLVYVKDVTIPDSLTDLKTLGADIKTWLELEATITLGLHNVLEQVGSGKEHVTTPGSLLQERIPTIGIPEFKTFLTKK